MAIFSQDTNKPLTKNTLERYFFDGVKKNDDLQVGVEWEKLGVYRDSGQAIHYSGANGVEGIFDALIKKYAWRPVYSGDHVIALVKNESSLTLEPGGQIELSGHKAPAIGENAAELYAHLSEIKEVSAPLGIVWLGLGAHPVSEASEIEWVPKSRYKIMRETLPGTLTHSMMKETAAIQISIDYTHEKDAVQKMQLAMGLSPFLSAIYGNSPLSKGKPNGLLSRRAHIWLETAPGRSGLIRQVFEPEFDFSAYTRHALSVPMIFIIRDDKWIPMNRMTFENFLEKGYGVYRATPADWDLHLTTLFTEARLKKYIEIRSIDCQRTEMGLSIPAFVKGLFYDENARENAWKMVFGLSWDERLHLASEVPKKGLKTPFRGGLLLHAAQELLSLAEAGLSRLDKEKGRVETGYLKPLQETLSQKKNPAEILLEKLGESFGDLSASERARKIIEASEI